MSACCRARARSSTSGRDRRADGLRGLAARAGKLFCLRSNAPVIEANILNNRTEEFV
jgi:hypothetical protein